MSTRGIDIRQSSSRIVFRVSLKDAAGDKVVSGTTELRLYRVEDDGTLDVYDWTTNDFVETGSGTPDDETTMTHRQRRDSSGADVDTGIWTAVLSTLTNFTAGQVYIAQVTNSGAAPESQEREFQFGGVEGGQLGVATEGRTLVVESDGMAHADLKECGGATVAAGAIPDAAADAAGGLPISDAGGLDLDTLLGRLDAAISSRSSHTANNVRDAILDRVLSGNHDTAGTPGKLLQAVTEARLAELDGANIPADLDTLLARLTAARAGYLDKLNIAGNVASSIEVTSIQNNTRAVRVVPAVAERPAVGSIDFVVNLLLYDELGNMEEPDSAPTIAVANQVGTSRSGNLDSTTMSEVSTGHYTATYTLSSTDALEQLVTTFTVIEGGSTRKYENQTMIVDAAAVDFTAADRAKLNALHDTRLTDARATALDNLDQAISATESNIRGADSDTLKGLSDQLDTAQADLDDPDQFKANVSGLSTFNPASDKVKFADVDGVAFDDYMEALIAVLFGVAAPSGSTVAFKKRDGTTTKVTVTYGSSDGERTGSVLE